MTRLFGPLALIFLLTLAGSASATEWKVPTDFATIQEAIDDAGVVDGDTILVLPGEHFGALVTKSVVIQGKGKAIISDGPPHPAGVKYGFRLNAGSDGTTITKLRFQAGDNMLAIMNGAAVNNVTVEKCKFYNALQAVTNWRGNNWTIQKNRIYDLHTRCGGGIGILVGDYAGGTVEGNLVAKNTVKGTLTVPAGDCGGYNGSGIVLYADFRWGGAGTAELKDNVVAKNKVRLVTDNQGSDNPLDVVALELTDSRDDPDADPYPVIFDNLICANNLKQTALEMDLTPEDLVNQNAFLKKCPKGYDDIDDDDDDDE